MSLLLEASSNSEPPADGIAAFGFRRTSGLTIASIIGTTTCRTIASATTRSPSIGLGGAAGDRWSARTPDIRIGQTWASTPHIASPAISDNRALAQARPDVLQRQRDHELRTAESVNAIVVRRPNPPRKDCSRK